MSDGQRKFARGLSRPGTASKRRESAMQAVRDSMYSSPSIGSELIKSTLSDPIDYEVFVLKRQNEILNDPQRNLLEFPQDDFEVTLQPQDRRTVVDSVPDGADREVSSLMVEECIRTYQNNWHLINNKYDAYAGSYLQLPKSGLKAPHLEEVVYEVDEEADLEEDSNLQLLQREGIAKQGWLYKAPSYSGSSISIRSLKRRYFDLKQMPDSSYILNFYKDEKTTRDPKGAIYLDLCIGAHSVSLTSKGRKHAFEIRLQDTSSHLLAADTEIEAQEWIATINQALQPKIEPPLSNEDTKNAQENESIKPGNTMESLQGSKHPELVKYSKETEQKNASARKDGRLNLIHIHRDFQEIYLKDSKSEQSTLPPPPIKQPKHRVMVQCKTISFNIRGVLIEGAEEPKTSVEPFFVTLSLYDVTQMRKISADVHVDLNHPLVRKMIPDRELSPKKASTPVGSLHSDSDDGKIGEPVLSKSINKQYIAYPKNCVFNVSRPNPDIFLVVRIEKVLQGSIKSCAQPYMKTDGDISKTAMKVLKHAKAACHRLGQYRMPFAWTAKPIFADNQGSLDLSPFEYIYKQESSKLAEEHLLKYLSDFRRPEKLQKLEDIECTLTAGLDFVPSDVTSLMTSSLVPIKPYKDKVETTLEVDEFLPTSLPDQYMHMEYTNHYYIYPRFLKYDNQKSFTKARNIAVVIEFKDSDAEGAMPLRSFYNRPGSEVFAKRVSAAVLHHNETPEFYEEFKLALPPQLHSGHHLLFSFYHVIVDTSGKKKDVVRTEIGHAWLPILAKDGQIWCNENVLPVCANLPPGYLTHNELNPTMRGQHTGPELKWVDGGKQLFRVSTRIISSVYTTDPHIHNFFASCQRSIAGSASDQDVVKYLKTLLAADEKALIQFLPTVLNQLFRLLASRKSSRDVKANAIKSLVHIVDVCHRSNNHKDLLKQYIKYMFVTEPWKDFQSHTVHEELVTSMTELLRPVVTDFLTSNKILRHLSFFLEIVVKSMAQHLIMSKKVKQKRNERFPVSFQHAIQSLLTTTVPHIIEKWENHYDEVCNANRSIAQFVKSCFTYVDRGFIFRLINHYMEHFKSGDPKVLFEFKFEFLRIVCSHEHYIQLNLPFAASVKKGKPVDSWWIKQKDYDEPFERGYGFSLGDEYCKNHFLTGHLLQNLNAAMYEPAEVRSIAIDTLKNLLAKHAFDDRYNTPGHQARIAALYLPFLRIVLDNVGRFSTENDGSYSSRNDLDHTPAKANDAPLVNVFSPQVDRSGGSLRGPPRTSDINMLSAISNPSTYKSSPRSSIAVNENQATAALDKVVDKNLSLTSATRYTSADCFDIFESRSLLLCFLQILKNIPQEALKGFWMQSTTEEQIEFFDIIEVCMRQFRYTGKPQQPQNIRFESVSKKTGKSMTLPVRIRPGTSHQYKNISLLAEPMVCQSEQLGEAELARFGLLEANLASEVGMIILDVLGDFARHFKKYLLNKDGDNPLMQKISSVFLLFLQISQSERVLKHAFASLRLFLCKFQAALFKGKADLCASLIYHALKCCNSKLASTRAEACGLLYLIMRTNFEFSSRKNFVRSQLQMIKAVSQLISQEVGISNKRFQNSLSVINSYVQSDKGMQHSVFEIEVKVQTKRIQTVLMATAAMKEHKDDPEMLIDLQYSLAKSYAATPELRKTWLESMARVHEKNGNFSEAAMCYIHIAALVAEYLKRKDIKDRSETSSKGLIGKGCSAFRAVSPNVEKEESAIKEDTGMQDVQYNEDVLTELLRRCVSVLESAERYELMASVYRMIIPFYEKKRDYMGLVEIYGTLKEAYTKIVQVNTSGKRMLGTYFRVAFYGQQYFDEEHGKEYIYKEPKLTQLSEISMRLQHMYGQKFGQENVRLIQESNKVKSEELDPKFAYIQVTYVQPYFDEQEAQNRKNYFEKAHNIRNFMFETPFTQTGKARGGIEEQWKRKTILTTSHSFPYVKKRIMVISTKLRELKPIEVALDAMENKCEEIEELVSATNVDLKKLQLRLQGAVSVTVNAGPLAYAKAFLEDTNISSHPANTVDRLRKIFRRFVALCGRALELNEEMISSDQYEYHENLKECYFTMASELSQILHEQLIGDEDDALSLTASSIGEAESVFSAISSISSPKVGNFGGIGSVTNRNSISSLKSASGGHFSRRNLQGAVADSSNV